jgi:hypothetical protein
VPADPNPVTTLKVVFNEAGVNSTGTHHFDENWYFDNNIGPVKVETITQDAYIPGTQTCRDNGQCLLWQNLELVTFVQGSGSAGPQGVTLRDALMAKAAATGGLTWYQWNYYLQQILHVAVQDSDACVSNPSATISIDTYIGYLESVGGSCTVLHYDDLPNSQGNPNDVAYLMFQAAPTGMLDWDHWNYYFNQVTSGQITPSAPEDVCQPSITYFDTQSGSDQSVIGNRYMLLTVRQWLLLYEHVYIPSTFPCV